MAFRPSNRQLEYFVAVCNCGNFRAAARSCNVSQPTLSTQLKLLERQLGTALVERGKPQARPTPAGASLLPIARNILASLDELSNGAGVMAKNLGGRLQIGVASTFGPYFLPHLLPQLRQRFPLLEVFIHEDRPPALAAALADRLIDCIITPLPIPDGHFEIVEICQEDIYLGVPADHPVAGAECVTPQMLSGEKLLTLGQAYRLYTNVKSLADAANATVREDYEGTSLDAIRQMVSMGMGCSLFPELYVRSEFPKEMHVVLRKLKDWPISRTICLAWSRNSIRANHFSQLAQEARFVASEIGLRLNGP
jgi:LysR family transcriptional regulator, hydrogen peroxide-inducible genes activator